MDGRMEHITCEERLRDLDLFSLEQRLQSDLTVTFFMNTLRDDI